MPFKSLAPSSGGPRRIQLPSGTELSAIEANFAKGVLTVKAPKPAPRVMRTIEIKKAA